MAITLVKQPQQLQPVYNEIVYVLASTLSTEENFNFIATISSSGLVLAVIKFPVSPDGYATLDVHKHLQALVTNDFDPQNTGFTEARNSYTDYDIEFAETFRPVWEFDYTFNGTPGSNLRYVGPAGGPDPNLYFGINSFIVAEQAPSVNAEAAYNGLVEVLFISYDPATTRWTIEVNKKFTVNTTNNNGIITTANFANITLPVGQTVTGKQAFNGVLSFNDFINWNYDYYNVNTITNTGHWLTNAPNPYKLKLSSYIWLNVYSDIDSGIGYLKVTKGLLDYYLINPTETGGENLFQVNISPSFLTQANFVDATGSEPIVPFSLQVGDCYSVSVVENLGDANSIIAHTFCIYESCTRYEDIQLVFMDKLGSFIPFHFDLVHRHNKSIARETYQKDYGKYAPASNNWKYNSWDRGTKTLDTRVTDVFTINSDWVDQTTSDFLMTLIESPEVYWFKENGDVVGINLTVSNIERKQTINDQLVNYTLTFELSNKDKQQIG